MHGASPPQAPACGSYLRDVLHNGIDDVQPLQRLPSSRCAAIKRYGELQGSRRGAGREWVQAGWRQVLGTPQHTFSDLSAGKAASHIGLVNDLMESSFAGHEPSTGMSRMQNLSTVMSARGGRKAKGNSAFDSTQQGISQPATDRDLGCFVLAKSSMMCCMSSTGPISPGTSRSSAAGRSGHSCQAQRGRRHPAARRHSPASWRIFTNSTPCTLVCIQKNRALLGFFSSSSSACSALLTSPPPEAAPPDCSSGCSFSQYCEPSADSRQPGAWLLHRMSHNPLPAGH